MAENNSTSKQALNFINIAGMKFGMLLVVEIDPSSNPKNLKWKCICDCGMTTVALGSNIRRGLTKSCGCSRTKWKAKRPISILIANNQPEYSSWRSAKQRCSHPKYPHYERYGGRGITMCEEWQMSFEKFLSHMGQRPAGTSLDRINNDGNYEPGNCRWADQKTQCNNRSKR